MCLFLSIRFFGKTSTLFAVQEQIAVSVLYFFKVLDLYWPCSTNLSSNFSSFLISNFLSYTFIIFFSPEHKRCSHYSDLLIRRVQGGVSSEVISAFYCSSVASKADCVLCQKPRQVANNKEQGHCNQKVKDFSIFVVYLFTLDS